MNEDVKYIINKLNENDFEAFIVGGSVRDMILKRPSNDYDITTSAEPYEVKEIFIKTFDTGIKHGTVTVVLNNINYEVTTYRIDGKYEDNRRPSEVVFTKTLEEDLLRRDFTMNAIAYNEKLGLIDPFNGQEDIKNKLIRGVGNPDKRFKEDALRIMRGIRFSSQLNFTIEEKTYKAILDNSHLLENISIERIRDEFLKIISTNNPEKIKLLSCGKIFKNINVNIYKYLLQYENEIISSMENSNNDLILRLSMFFQKYNLLELEDELRFLRLDNKIINLVVTVVSNLDVIITENSYVIKKLVNSMGHDTFIILINAKEFITRKSHSNILTLYNDIINEPIFLKDLAINGNDLKTYGIKDGACIGKTLAKLLDIVLKSPNMNEKDILLSLLDNK